MLQAKLVAVRKITSDSSEMFSEARVESIAQSILACGGLANPLILTRNGEGYKLAKNQLGYLAAVRAREIDARKGEMIQAIILDDVDAAILDQL